MVGHDGLVDAERTSTVRRYAGALAGALGVALTGVGAFFDPHGSGWGLAWVAYPLVGGLILWRRPGNLIGWLLVGIGVTLGANLWVGVYVDGSRGPGPVAVELVAAAVSPLAFIMLIALTALFPSGRTTTRSTRVVVRTAGALSVVIVAAFALGQPLQQDGATGRPNPWAVPSLEPLTAALTGAGFAIVPFLMAVSMISLVARWRRSHGPERLQFRWFLLGVAVTIAAMVVLLATSYGGEMSVLSLVLIGSISVLPVSIGVAVTRYHLYDIDRVISRTASYAVVTGVLLVTYAAVAAGVSVVMGKGSTIAVAAATLTAAAVARPALRRVQDGVDRRFNRARFDAAHTVHAFGSRLRNQVETGQIREDLLHTVNGALEPASSTVWLRTSAERSP